MNQPDRRPLKGTLSWSDGKDMHITVGIDRLALAGGRVAMVSVVGYTNEIKAFRAGLAVITHTSMSLAGPDGYRLPAKHGTGDVNLHQAWALPGRRYYGESCRLGYNVLHAIFIARNPGLMLENTDEALWYELKQPRFTTPLLRGWLPYLRQELVAANKLVHCDCVDCDCMGLTAVTKDLDSIVESGLKNGHITIHEEAVA